MEIVGIIPSPISSSLPYSPFPDDSITFIKAITISKEIYENLIETKADGKRHIDTWANTWLLTDTLFNEIEGLLRVLINNKYV